MPDTKALPKLKGGLTETCNFVSAVEGLRELRIFRA